MKIACYNLIHIKEKPDIENTWMRPVGYQDGSERSIYGESALLERYLKTSSECPLIGNGDSVTIRMKWF